MPEALERPPIAWFGKLPSRGDFVRAAANPQLVDMLDRWLAQTIETMSADARWKIAYDAAPPLHFAFLGSRSKVVVAGHLVASRDSSDRRFPFIAASLFEVDEPLAFLARSPLALSRFWARLEPAMRAVAVSADAGPALETLAGIDARIETTPHAYDANFDDFTEMQSVGGLEALLRAAGHVVSVRRLMLALGILLEPVLTSASPRLEKGLALPLPLDPIHRYLVATFWFDLIARFLARGDFELAVFMRDEEGRPMLSLGFNGASARTLQGALDPEAGRAQNISPADADWVEAHVAATYGVKKFASYLERPQLSLRAARDSFCETFIGA